MYKLTTKICDALAKTALKNNKYSYPPDYTPEKIEMVQIGELFPGLKRINLLVPKHEPKDEYDIKTNVSAGILRFIQKYLVMYDDSPQYNIKSIKDIDFDRSLYEEPTVSLPEAFSMSKDLNSKNRLEHLIKLKEFKSIYKNNCIDLSELYKFPIKSGYHRLGAKALFDQNDNLLYIRYENTLYTKKDVDYEMIENIMLASIRFYMVAIEHGLHIHILSCTSVYSQPEEIRRIVHPFHYRTTQALVKKLKSLIYDNKARFPVIFKYDIDVIAQIFEYYIAKFDFYDLPNKNENLYTAIELYINQIDLTEQQKKYCTTLIYRYVVQHHIVGTLAAEYFITFPSFVKLDGSLPNGTYIRASLFFKLLTNLPDNLLKDIKDKRFQDILKVSDDKLIGELKLQASV